MSDKMSFHGLERGMRADTNVYLFFSFFLHGWENVPDVIMHSQMRTVNFVYNTHGKSKYENACDKAACQLEMKRSRMREGENSGERKQWKLPTVQMR